MSGHSKWHNIQAKKGKADAARGKIFTKIGREIAIAVREAGSNPDVMMMMALEAGAEDVKADEDAFEIYTAPNDLSSVRESLENQGVSSFLTAEVQMIPQNTVAVEGENLEAIQKMLELLDDYDDVQEVFHNAELPEEEEEE